MDNLNVSYKNLEKNINYRSKSISDKAVIRQIFNEKCFDFSTFSQAKNLEHFHNTNLKKKMIPLILDAGANIGAAAVWFSMAYPEADIVSIEPENDNLNVLRENAVGTNISVIEGAIGCEYKILFLHDPGFGEWGYRVTDVGDGRQISIKLGSDILNSKTNHFPFICKIDIEGSESDLFLKNTQWMKSFALIIIELHDWMLPGKANSKNFFKFISEGNYDVLYRGELIFAFNNEHIY